MWPFVFWSLLLKFGFELHFDLNDLTMLMLMVIPELLLQLLVMLMLTLMLRCLPRLPPKYFLFFQFLVILIFMVSRYFLIFAPNH